MGQFMQPEIESGQPPTYPCKWIDGNLIQKLSTEAGTKKLASTHLARLLLLGTLFVVHPDGKKTNELGH